MEAARRFAAELDGVDRAEVVGLLEACLEGLAWEDPYGEPASEPPGDLLHASTFGETVHDAIEVAVGRFRIRYPAPSQQRAAGLQLVDAASLVQAGLEDLGEVLFGVEEHEALARRLALAAATAAQPGGRFKWEDGRLHQAYDVVGEVEQWPGQIQLQAARRYEPELRIGDVLWVDGREQIPVSWVLDWLRS